MFKMIPIRREIYFPTDRWCAWKYFILCIWIFSCLNSRSEVTVLKGWNESSDVSQQRISVYRTSQKDSLHMRDLPTHLSDPTLQSLTYSLYVLSPLGATFTRTQALYALKATRERNTFLTAAWNSLSSSIFFYCLHTDPTLMSRWWWHLLSPLLSFHGKVRTFLWIHPGRTLYPCLWTCSRFQFRRLGRGMMGGWIFYFKRPTPHPVVSKKVPQKNMCSKFLQPNNVNYNLL